MIEDILAVFSLAIFEMWIAIPLGLHLDISPMLLTLIVVSGAFLGAVVAMYVGDGVRRLIFWRKPGVDGNKTSRWLATKGPWAIGLLGPGLVGPMLAALLAGTAGLPRHVSILLLGIGIVVWTVAIIILGTLGFAVMR